MQDLVQITRFPRSEYYQLIRQLNERKNEQILKPQLPLDKLTKWISENVATDLAVPVPDCTTCGVCCAFPLIVPVSLEESQRLRSFWDVVFDEDDSVVADRVLPRNAENGYCGNLEGAIGEHVTCTAYEDRPKACRDFQAGSDRCHEYRRMYGFEPQLSVEQVGEATAKLNAKGRPAQIDFVRILVAEMSFETEPLADGTLTRTKRTKLKIVALMDDDPEKTYIIHTFDPSEETWFESDFLAMSLDEAREMIASRTEK